MKINTVNYLIGDAFKSLKRNRTICIASIITVFITFVVLGAFLLIAQNAGLAIEGVQDKIEIKVFLTKDIKLTQERELQVKIREQDGVSEVTYESKEDAYNKVMENNPNFLKGYTLDSNPFPASYIVKIKDTSKIQGIIDALKDLPGVESIDNQQDMIDTMQNVISGIRWVGIILFIVLIAVSVFLIMNTTRLTVYSRRKEIGIMKFVGATDWFIRWPFIIEGIVIGLSGAVLAAIVLFFIYKAVFNYLTGSITMMLTSFIPATYVFSTLLWIFMLCGVVIGAVASILAIRRFLKV
ncbi:MAG: permease-like cell division protein FtsX [Clostridium sp.]|nr:permease-like cell division protein FtsX [Clostridium sp.]MDY3828411.1 permease-like cell division protein FtsX [Clostridium sp.]